MKLERARRVTAATWNRIPLSEPSRVLVPLLVLVHVLVDANGRVKLLDFGIAKMMEGDSGETPTALTRDGESMLTPEYASPEQLTAGDVTTATDVYALGIMLYQALANRLPFIGETAIEILMKASKNPVPSFTTVIKPGTYPIPDKTIESICFRALAKRAQDRYPSAEALAGDLSLWLEGKEVHVQPPAATRRKSGVKRAPSMGILAMKGKRVCDGSMIAPPQSLRFKRLDRHPFARLLTRWSRTRPAGRGRG